MEAFNGILTLLTFFPLLGVLLMLLLSWFGRRDDELFKRIAVGTSIITFIISIVVLLMYDRGIAGLQLEDRALWIPSLNISYYLAVDGLSILMVLLTTFITMLRSPARGRRSPSTCAYYVLMLLLKQACSASSWRRTSSSSTSSGVYPGADAPHRHLGGAKRVYASIKFFHMRWQGLLMLLAILYMGINYDTFALPDLIANVDFPANVGRWLFLGFAIAFAIKVPLFPFHSWLPDAHTEAPTAGSIILAGILLKMGTYGFMRFNLPLFPEASAFFAPTIAVLAIIGIIYGAIVSFAQSDVKRLVAYSSVSHLGFVMLGIFSLNNAGLQGAILQGVNHGLSTGGLFYLVGVLYEQRHTRDDEFGGVWRHAGLHRSQPDHYPIQYGAAGTERLRRRVHHPARLHERIAGGAAAPAVDHTALPRRASFWQPSTFSGCSSGSLWGRWTTRRTGP